MTGGNDKTRVLLPYMRIAWRCRMSIYYVIDSILHVFELFFRSIRNSFWMIHHAPSHMVSLIYKFRWLCISHYTDTRNHNSQKLQFVQSTVIWAILSVMSVTTMKKICHELTACPVAYSTAWLYRDGPSHKIVSFTCTLGITYIHENTVPDQLWIRGETMRI